MGYYCTSLKLSTCRLKVSGACARAAPKHSECTKPFSLGSVYVNVPNLKQFDHLTGGLRTDQSAQSALSRVIWT